MNFWVKSVTQRHHQILFSFTEHLRLWSAIFLYSRTTQIINPKSFPWNFLPLQSHQPLDAFSSQHLLPVVHTCLLAAPVRASTCCERAPRRGATAQRPTAATPRTRRRKRRRTWCSVRPIRTAWRKRWWTWVTFLQRSLHAVSMKLCSRGMRTGWVSLHHWCTARHCVFFVRQSVCSLSHRAGCVSAYNIQSLATSNKCMMSSSTAFFLPPITVLSCSRWLLTLKHTLAPWCCSECRTIDQNMTHTESLSLYSVYSRCFTDVKPTYILSKPLKVESLAVISP